MDFDILNLEPTKISRDLRGKYLLLFGLPKCGKTSFAVKAPKNLLIAFERGYNALPGIFAVPVQKWSEFRKIVRTLEQDEAKEQYYTITIDTVTIAWQKCEEFICAQEGVDSIADIPWGRGYAMAKQEFENVLRKITMLGYGLICLAHSEEKPVSMGSEDTIIRPLLNKRAYEIVNGLVDVIGYIGVSFDENGDSQRHLYTRSTPEIFAGSRFQHLPAKIPFGYEELTKALAEAIEQAGGEAGGLIVDHDTTEETIERNFDVVMNEAKEVWMSLNKDKETIAKAGEIIERNFGKPMKLSEATEKQQEIVEIVVQELKELL